MSPLKINKLASSEIANAAATPLEMPIATAAAATMTKIVGSAKRIAVSAELDGTKVHNNAMDHSNQIPTVDEMPVIEDI
jgi:hypothetical protein